MTRRTLAATVALCMLGLTACDDSCSDGWTTIERPAGFAVEVPSSWKVIIPVRPDAQALERDPDPNMRVPEFSSGDVSEGGDFLAVFPDTTAGDIREVATEWGDSMAVEMSDFVFEESESSLTAEATGSGSAYGTEGELLLHLARSSAPAADTTWVLYCMTPDMDDSDCPEVASRFEVLKPVQPPSTP